MTGVWREFWVAGEINLGCGRHHHLLLFFFTCLVLILTLQFVNCYDLHLQRESVGGRNQGLIDPGTRGHATPRGHVREGMREGMQLQEGERGHARGHATPHALCMGSEM